MEPDDISAWKPLAAPQAITTKTKGTIGGAPSGARSTAGAANDGLVATNPRYIAPTPG